MGIAFCLRKGVTMKLVIDIPQEEYEDILNGIEHARIAGVSIGILNQAIENGTPLPKGHGRLGDLDALIERLLPKYYDWFGEGEQDDFSRGNNSMLEEVVEAIKEFPTIIEADNKRGE